MERRYDLNNETEAIREVQRYLLSVTPEESNNGITRHGKYDDNTEAAVRAFQISEGLEETGIVDYDTWNLLYARHLDQQDMDICLPEIALFDMQLGDIGYHILLLQTLLGELAAVYPNVTRPALTGQFGLTTADAVRAMQRNYGRVTDGTVSSALWNFMLRDNLSKKQITQYLHIF